MAERHVRFNRRALGRAGADGGRPARQVLDENANPRVATPMPAARTLPRRLAREPESDSDVSSGTSGGMDTPRSRNPRAFGRSRRTRPRSSSRQADFNDLLSQVETEEGERTLVERELAIAEDQQRLSTPARRSRPGRRSSVRPQVLDFDDSASDSTPVPRRYRGRPPHTRHPMAPLPPYALSPRRRGSSRTPVRQPRGEGYGPDGPPGARLLLTPHREPSSIRRGHGTPRSTGVHGRSSRSIGTPSAPRRRSTVRRIDLSQRGRRRRSSSSGDSTASERSAPTASSTSTLGSVRSLKPRSSRAGTSQRSAKSSKHSGHRSVHAKPTAKRTKPHLRALRV